MKVILREDESGVSEVVGTILILAMTVVLFSTIILYVTNIPAPVTQTKVDILGSFTPAYSSSGPYAWVNLTDQGGPTMTASATILYFTDAHKVGTSYGASQTSTIRLVAWGSSGSTTTTSAYGVFGGSGTSWTLGQQFLYKNTTYLSSDQVTVTVVDTSRSLVLWSSVLTPPAGNRPPVFLNVYAAENNVGTTLSVQAGSPFYVFAQVMDPDGDLNVNSVYANLTYYYGIGPANCTKPLKMYDDGRASVDGDVVANDGTFTLGGPLSSACTGVAIQGMDGSLVLFNATDLKGHQTTTRMILHVVPGTSSSGSGSTSSSWLNLLWNGQQGYNLFNATQWAANGYGAVPTRTFKVGDTGVVVVASATLQNVLGTNTFTLWDAYNGTPATAVVYGVVGVTVGPKSSPSNTSAFTFYQFLNGYYIYTYSFPLPSVNFCTYGATGCSHPRYYYYGSYSLSVQLRDNAGDRFTTSDAISITATNGTLLKYPAVTTFADSGFTKPSSVFSSTATMYVQVQVKAVNANTSMTGVSFGNIQILSFVGAQELDMAPMRGFYANSPICSPAGSCSFNVTQAIWSKSVVVSGYSWYYYWFAINLARVSQDPWVAGPQYYALTLTQFKDTTPQSYSDVSVQIQVQAPLHTLDLVTGVAKAKGSWGSNDSAYFYQDVNGYNAWNKLRVDYCASGTNRTTSGLLGGKGCPTPTNVTVAYGAFWNDGTLGIAESFQMGSYSAVEIYRRTVDATGAVAYLPVFNDNTTADSVSKTACTAITTGDVTGDGLPEVVCGGANGYVWYYANNGNWTPVSVSKTSGSAVTSIVVGDFNGNGWNDIAVGTSATTKNVIWYSNSASVFGTGGTLSTADAAAVTAMDEGSQNGALGASGYLYADLLVGTKSGHVYQYMGGSSGLTGTTQPTSGCLYYTLTSCTTTGSYIVGVAYGNFSTSSSYPGLKVAVAYGSTVKIIGGTSAEAVIATISSPSSSGTITAFGVGDVNGDGWDDFVVGTSTGYVYLWENLGQGTAWTLPWCIDSIGVRIYSLDLGDSTNSQYMGR